MSKIQARVPTVPTPDHLAGHLDEREVFEQVPAVGLQAAPVTAQHRADLLIDRGGLLIGENLLDRLDQRGVADDPPPSAKAVLAVMP
jgi:hypothetical protein